MKLLINGVFFDPKDVSIVMCFQSQTERETFLEQIQKQSDPGPTTIGFYPKLTSHATKAILSTQAMTGSGYFDNEN